jgi:hypothetical protein
MKHACSVCLFSLIFSFLFTYHFDKEDDLAMLLDLLLVEGLVQAGQQDISH